MSTGTEGWECLGFFGFLEVRKLRPGVLDADATHVFTKGHCHSFAEAIRRLCSAADIVFAFDHPDEDDPLGGVQGHILAYLDGRYLDARGWLDELVDVEDAARAFEEAWDMVLAIKPEGWTSISERWLPLRVEEAMPFAAALLERLEVPTDAAC